MQMRKRLLFRIFIFFISFLVVGLFTGCYMLRRFIYTDAELEQHFQDKELKPVYKKLDYLNRPLHYASISRSDTLPLLILVHGAPGAWYGYLNLMEDTVLQKNFKMVSLDRFGYGKSGYGHPEISTQVQALEIKRIVEEENSSGKKVYLLGRSYGAPIAAWYAINYPQQVERLVMASPVIDPDKEKFYWFSSIGRWRITQWLLPQLLNVATSEKYSHAAQMKLMLNKWKKLYVPSYVITGANDQIADTANFSFAKRVLVNCPTTFTLLANTGHQVTRQHPEVIKKYLLERN